MELTLPGQHIDIMLTGGCMVVQVQIVVVEHHQKDLRVRVRLSRLP